ncbi:MAG: histidine kinase, partial [Lachnospiraceae bacterium]|nr:histidine kinase [Lachnospiraceae bacterium]
MKKRTCFQTIKYRNLRMKNKIIVSIYLILLPILLIGTGIIYIWIYHNTMRDELTTYQRFVQTISENIDYMQQDVLDISDYFAVNAGIHQLLLNEKEKYQGDGLFWTKNTPVSFVSDILAIKSQIKTVILYPENGLSPFYISRDASVHNTHIEHIRELPFYEEAAAAMGDIIWKRVKSGNQDIFLYNKSDKMVAYRILFDMAKRRRLGVLAIGIEVSRYDTICSNVIKYPNEGVVIMDSLGQVLLSSGQVNEDSLEELSSVTAQKLKELQTSSNTDEPVRLSSQSSYLFAAPNSKDNMIICYVSPKENWRMHTQADLLLPATMMILLLVMAWPLSAIISGSLSRSVKTLLASMERFQNGDFSQQVEVVGLDEIGELSMGFNHMAAETKRLIDRNYVMALKEREIELNALQAQINPHFLYNVLDSLYWEAIDAGSEKLGEDILALSELFRLLLSQGESEITVGREMDLITRYLQIQRMRFSRSFFYKIDVEEQIMQYKISKLLLQPFVENAIVHRSE